MGLGHAVWFTHTDANTTGIHIDRYKDQTILFQRQNNGSILVYRKEPGGWDYLGIAYPSRNSEWMSSLCDRMTLPWETQDDAIADIVANA